MILFTKNCILKKNNKELRTENSKPRELTDLLMVKTTYLTDPGFGKQKNYAPKDLPGATESQYKSDGQYMKGIRDSDHAGADVLFTQPDYYSNPNKTEHVTSFPMKLRSDLVENRTKVIVGGFVVGLLVYLVIAR